MFRGLISDAKAAAGAVIVKYVARASVAIPFLIAAGFATAAVTMMLVDRFGALLAYWMLAGGFLAIGLLATLVVTVKEQEEVVAEEAKAADAPSAAAEVALQAPLAILGGLLSSPVGPGSALSIIRLLGRNLPLVFLIVLAGVLLWPTEAADGEQAEGATDDADAAAAAAAYAAKPNGLHPDGVGA